MAVFLHYLISNNDPSSLFFYLVTDSYASGNLKEMKKWAYDIFSTFMGSQGPLRIQVSDNVVASVERTINSQINNEEAMRYVFHPARMDAKEEVEDFLTEFRRQRALGLGSIFGDQLLTNDDMDRARELKIVESTLLPHLERLTTLEAEKEPKNQALAAAITTFMKQVGVKVQNSALERAPSFMNKDRRNMLSKFNRPSKKHNMKGHQFVEIQCLNTTFCQQCNGPLWGIGYQGYQCTNCEFTVHRTGLCLEQITRECSKKKSKKPRGVTIPINPTPPTIVQMKSTNEDLSHLKQEANNAQLPQGQVVRMVDRFDPTDPSRTKQPEGLVSPLPPDTGPPSAEPRPPETESKRIKVHRTGSLKSKGERKLKTDNKRSRSIYDLPARMQYSIDVDMDNQSVTDVLTRSQASSSSSISTGQDSPRTSLEHLARQIDEDDSDMEAEASTPNWQKSIDKDIVRKLKPKEVKRQEVINGETGARLPCSEGLFQVLGIDIKMGRDWCTTVCPIAHRGTPDCMCICLITERLGRYAMITETLGIAYDGPKTMSFQVNEILSHFCFSFKGKPLFRGKSSKSW
ncbi:rho guanine nucleotide exchange factor 11-like [Diadema antillarum]